MVSNYMKIKVFIVLGRILDYRACIAKIHRCIQRDTHERGNEDASKQFIMLVPRTRDGIPTW